MRDRSSAGRLGYVVKRVVFSRVSAVIWCAAVFLTVPTVSSTFGPWPLACGLVAQGAYLAYRLRDERFLQKLFADRLEHDETAAEADLEAQLESMDFETRQRLRYVLQLRKEIVKEARSDDVAGYARAELERVAVQLLPVVRNAAKLALRRQRLVRHLAQFDDQSLRRYVTDLQQRISATTDPVTRGQYEQALKARQSEMQTYLAIAQAAERIESQLESVEATLASWKAKVIRLKSIDDIGAAAYGQGLQQDLAEMTNDINLLDASVTEALAVDDDALLQARIG